MNSQSTLKVIRPNTSRLQVKTKPKDLEQTLQTPVDTYKVSIISDACSKSNEGQEVSFAEEFSVCGQIRITDEDESNVYVKYKPTLRRNGVEATLWSCHQKKSVPDAVSDYFAFINCAKTGEQEQQKVFFQLLKRKESEEKVLVKESDSLMIQSIKDGDKFYLVLKYTDENGEHNIAKLETFGPGLELNQSGELNIKY